MHSSHFNGFLFRQPISGRIIFVYLQQSILIESRFTTGCQSKEFREATQWWNFFMHQTQTYILPFHLKKKRKPCWFRPPQIIYSEFSNFLSGYWLEWKKIGSVVDMIRSNHFSYVCKHSKVSSEAQSHFFNNFWVSFQSSYQTDAHLHPQPFGLHCSSDITLSK